MCLSLPGRVVQLDGPRALIETAGSARWSNALMFPELRVGDRVLLHAGLIIEVISEEHAREIESGFEELNALTETEATAMSADLEE
jgi:hydrogenase expression/formation protein HypC